MGEAREPGEIDPRYEEAVAAWLTEDWSGEPEPSECEVREVGVWEPPPAPEPPPRVLLSVEEAGRMLDCSRSLMYEFIRAKELPVVKLGRLTRISVDAVHELARRGARVPRRRKQTTPWWEDMDR